MHCHESSLTLLDFNSFKIMAVRFPNSFDLEFYAIPGMATRSSDHEKLKRKNPFSDIIEMMNYLDDYDMLQ